MAETEYASEYACAYPTKVIAPAPDPDNTGHGTTLTSQTTTTYDFATGLPLKVTDDFGQTIKTEYNDALLRPTKTLGDNVTIPMTETIYNDDLLTVTVRKQIDETNWDEATTFSDSLGRTYKTQAKDSQGDVVVETKYDNFGRVEKTSNPYRVDASGNPTETVHWTTPTYDELNRVKFVTTDDGAKVETQYSLATTGANIGSVVTVIDQALKQRRSITNALGQLARVDEPNDAGNLGDIASPTQPTLYEYDGLNNLKKVTQGEQVRIFTYDYLSRLKTATNPESGIINYTYDLIGNLKTKTDARNITTTYDYDKLNRVIKRDYSDSTPDVDYFYDGKGLTNSPTFAKGKLTKVVTSATATNLVAETKYTNFDNFGRVLSSSQVTDGQTYNSAYTYNLSGALIEQTYPSGRVVRNTLNPNGDLQQVQSSKSQAAVLKNYANSFNYNASGAVASMKLGNGKWEYTTFNSRLQPIQIGLGSSATSQNLLKLNFEYGATANENNGNVTKQTITVPTIGVNQGFTATQNYTYDSLNRLKSAVETIPNQTGWKQTFIFDRYGNRTFDTANGNTTTLLSGCPTNVCNPSANVTNNKLVGANYDNSGNTTLDANNQTFVYDAENKQVQVLNSNGIVGNYFYDGDGKRIKKMVPNGETTIFVYDASGKMVAEYSTITASQADAKVSYLTSDHLGSPRINTDANGQVIARHDFRPFGEEVPRTTYGNDSIRNKFTSYERDTETSLDFAEARMYAYGLGRFIAVDPLMGSGKIENPQTFNRYVYVGNNPLRRIDKNGKEWFDVVTTSGTGKHQTNIHTPTWIPGNTPDGKKVPKDSANWTEYVYKADHSKGSPYFALHPSTGEAIEFKTKKEAQAQFDSWMQKKSEEHPIETPSWSAREAAVPRAPDYGQTELDIPVLGPEMPFVGVAIQGSLDRSGQTYVSVGGYVGTPGWNVTGAWLPQYYPANSTETYNFITEESGGVFVSAPSFIPGVGPGAGCTYYNGDYAPQVGIGSPGFAASATYGWRIGKVPVYW